MTWSATADRPDPRNDAATAHVVEVDGQPDARRASGEVWNERGLDVRASAESHRIVDRVRDHAHDRQAARVEDGRVRGAGEAEPAPHRHREEGKEGNE